jgi:hypothetical protein
MKTLIVGLVAFGLSASPAFAFQSDAQIRQSIIRDSIASYPGPCACPYSVMRNGRACGGRSAYSRPGGYAPICYPRDVTQAQIADWRRARR